MTAPDQPAAIASTPASCCARSAASRPIPHLGTCAECQQRLARTEALRQALGRIPIEKSTTSWEQAVWGRIATGGRKPQRRRLWVGLPVLLAAAGVILLVRSPGPIAARGRRPCWRWRSRRGPSVCAAAAPRWGRPSSSTAPPSSTTHAELRIYRDDAGLLLRCSTEPPCQRRDGRLGARFTIPAIGRYRVLLLQAPVPLPAPGSDGYDRDVAAVTRVQSSVHVEQSFEVW